MHRPHLSCAECGAAAIPAAGRGRYDCDGNEVRHRDECRCRWCAWWWTDDQRATCPECGTPLRVIVDDGHAHTRTEAP